MGAETETVEQTGSETGVEEVTNEGGEQGQGSSEVGASNAVDMETFQKLQTEHGQLSTNWSKIEELANRDPVFRRELERAWKGLPPAKQAEIKKEAQVQAQAKPGQAPQSNKEIEELRQNLKQMQEAFQGQQFEALKKEKFAEVQNETSSVQKRFGATDADMDQFWDRYGTRIRNEAYGFMQQRPGLPPTEAMRMAYARHDKNLAAEYIDLMEDRMVDFYGKKIRERDNPLRGINSPAEKAGKAGKGSTPSMQERFLSTLKKESNPEKRAQMYKAFAEETGMNPTDFFRSSGG
jgi:hypothetical protein